MGGPPKPNGGIMGGIPPGIIGGRGGNDIYINTLDNKCFLLILRFFV